MLDQLIRDAIKIVPNFPKEGIFFKDITPILMDPVLSQRILDHLYAYYRRKNIDKIAGIESRGFLIGYPLAIRLGVPFIMIRKEGKLPRETASSNYELEYGISTIEMHTDAINEGDRVLIHDDLLATGGSAAACAELIKQFGGEIVSFNFLINLEYLEGFKKLIPYCDHIISLVKY